MAPSFMFPGILAQSSQTDEPRDALSPSICQELVAVPIVKSLGIDFAKS